MSRQEFPFIKTILPSMRIVEQTVREMMARSNIINISVSTIELLQIDGFESAFVLLVHTNQSSSSTGLPARRCCSL